MPPPLDNLTDVCDRVLSRLKFRLLHVKAHTWKRLRPLVLRAVVRAVSIYRLRLRHVVFIGVTGSCGKTTTKEMVAAVLATHYTGRANPGSQNVLGDVIRSILLTRRGYMFCVQEFNISGIGEAVPLEKQLKMFKPQMGVVTTVGDDHISAHGSRAAIAMEKGKLIAALPKDGTAILNADDPLVLAMQSRCKGRILTYGLSPDALLRAEDIRDDWPNRLSLTVLHEGESVRVHTQLCGAHLVPNVLAAMAVGQAMGVSLRAAATAIEGLTPVPGRMCPNDSPDGVTFIRDDVKAPVWAIPATLDFMRRATAKRKIIILGTLSDYQGGAPTSTYARIARQALGAVDYVFFVGRWASRCLRARRHADDRALQAFVTVGHINGFLHGFLEPGDLVLLKGSRTDQLSHIVSAWFKKPQGRSVEVPLHLERSATSTMASDAPMSAPDGAMKAKGISQLIVGLGNPGKRFEHTPHNVGQRALDLLAELVQARWSQEGWGLAARAHVEDQPVLLAKPAIDINRTGPWMRQLANQWKLRPQDCVIIHDDINLEPGVVRPRRRGSSGGHKGVQSIIAAFESEEIPRVKIGVGLPTDGTPVIEHVVTPFETTKRDTIETACRQAAVRAFEMVKTHSRGSE